MKKEQRELIIIAVVLLAIIFIAGVYGWYGGEYRKACEKKCLDALNLSVIKSDYLSDSCYCVYEFNDTKIRV